MAETATAERATTPLMPVDDHRPVPVGLVATLIAHDIDRTRSGKTTVEGAVTAFLEKHQVALPDGQTSARVAGAIMELVIADQVYDSEFAQAARATYAVLGELFPSPTVAAAGWLPGQTVKRGSETFRLTGNACPSCENNPECYGIGGGVRCLDTAGCRWQFCF